MAKTTRKYITNKKNAAHASHAETLPRLRRAQGQVAAVGRMIEKHEYCPDILQQLRAAIAALQSLETTIMNGHLEHCVKDAMRSKNKADIDKKIIELTQLIKRS